METSVLQFSILYNILGDAEIQLFRTRVPQTSSSPIASVYRYAMVDSLYVLRLPESFNLCGTLRNFQTAEIHSTKRPHLNLKLTQKGRFQERCLLT